MAASARPSSPTRSSTSWTHTVTLSLPGLASGPPSARRMRGPMTVNGIDLGYEVFGSGDPLVLLHGGFGSVEMFGPNVDLLAARRQVVGVDLQSHGRSPAADRPLRFETMADDIAELIASLG